MKSLWYVSIRDLFLAWMTYAQWILTLSLICGLLFLFTRVTPDLVYKSKGVFHSSETPRNILSKSLQNLAGQDAPPFFHEDLKALINSNPVLEKVVKKLCLQASISQKKPLLRRMWNNILAEIYPFFCKKVGGILVAHKKLFFESESPLKCLQCEYNENTYTTIELHFLDESRFVYDHGIGKIGERAQLGGKNSFTLIGEDFCAGDRYTVTFFPLSIASAELNEKLKIAKEKKKSTFLNITCTDSFPNLAAAIVNEVMRSYKEYLLEQGEEKISDGLIYLENRKNNQLNLLKKTLEEEKEKLQRQLIKRSFFTSQAEVGYFHELQKKYHGEIDLLHQKLERIQVPPSPNPASFSLKAVDDVVISLERKIEDLEAKKNQLQIQSNQDLIDFDLLAKLLDGKLKTHFEHINHLQFCLIDKKNWMPKEQARMEEELLVEKKFLKTFICNELENITSQIEGVKKEITKHQGDLKALLIQERDHLEKCLEHISQKMALHLPEVWLHEEITQFSKKMAEEMIQGLSCAIEEKNLHTHLQMQNSIPLQWATPPAFPQPPKLFLSFVIGGLSCSLALTLLILFAELKKGATCSLTNMQALGLEMATDLNELYFTLSLSREKKFLFVSKRSGLMNQFEHYLKEKGIQTWELSECLSTNVKEVKYLSSLNSMIIYQITDERIKDLEVKGEKVIYYLPTPFPLRTIAPKLDRMIEKLFV